MKSPPINIPSILFVLTLLWVSSATADDVVILAAKFQQQASTPGSTQWSVSVTLKHNDSGWDHYADEWRIVGIDGQVFVTHPCNQCSTKILKTIDTFEIRALILQSQFQF